MDKIDLVIKEKNCSYITNICIVYNKIIDKHIYYSWFNTLNLSRTKVPYLVYISHINPDKSSEYANICDEPYTLVSLFISKKVKWVLSEKFDYIDTPVHSIYHIRDNKHLYSKMIQKYDNETYPKICLSSPIIDKKSISPQSKNHGDVKTENNNDKLINELNKTVNQFTCCTCKEFYPKIEFFKSSLECQKCRAINQEINNEKRNAKDTICINKNESKKLEQYIDAIHVINPKTGFTIKQQLDYLEDKVDNLMLLHLKSINLLSQMLNDKGICFNNTFIDKIFPSEKAHKIPEMKSGAYFISIGMAIVLFLNNVFHIEDMTIKEIEDKFRDKVVYVYGITDNIDDFMNKVHDKLKFFTESKDMIYNISTIAEIKKIYFTYLPEQLLESTEINLNHFFKLQNQEFETYRFSNDSFTEYIDFFNGQIVILDSEYTRANVSLYYKHLS